jgi:exopolysaccharide biosynthesis polyprenyl glycosylphosphotransferase
LIRDPVTDISRLSTVVSNGNFAVPFDVDANSSLSERLDPVKLQAAKVKTAVVAGGVAIPDVVRRSCEASGIRVLTEEEFLERQLARVNIERLPADWVSSANVARESKAETVLRRIFDILLGAFLLLATLPLLLLTALAIKLDSRGPVFYRQERVGLNGQSFMLFKFRSMRTDAEAGGTAIWASKQDPRVTRIGRFLRLTRIDEIPQVLNVLRGDMAFVGPRPERPAFVEQLGRIIPHYKDRALVKPGITGWAQVNYPYGASVEDARMKLAYDLYYVRRRSLFLDMLILVSTVRVVLFQEGAR